MYTQEDTNVWEHEMDLLEFFRYGMNYEEVLMVDFLRRR